MGARRRGRRERNIYISFLSPCGYEVGREEKPSKGRARNNMGETSDGPEVQWRREGLFSTRWVQRQILLHLHRRRRRALPIRQRVVLDMVQKLNSELGLITLDNDNIRTVCEKLLQDNKNHDRAMCDLTGLVKKSLDRPS